MTKVTTEDVEITLHAMAVDTIRAMHRRVCDIGAVYGFKSDEYVTATASLANALTTISTMGDVRYTRDGDLSLYGVTSYGMHFGVIFHRKGVPDWYKELHPHDTFAPEVGDWSFHS